MQPFVNVLCPASSLKRPYTTQKRTIASSKKVILQLNFATLNPMTPIPIFQVDAFSNELFKGNPAAVCMLQSWPSDSILQSIAAENNLAETAFVVRTENSTEIRWFTPLVEVDLCGHATLAAAFVLFTEAELDDKRISFVSPRSGVLSVTSMDEWLYLDFPTDTITEIQANPNIIEGIGYAPLQTYRGKTDYIALLNNEEEVVKLNPNLSAIAKLSGRGLIVTAKGSKCDFVSRFFAPQAGINEDPVTGSAHTSLIPFWSHKLGKTTMDAQQLSARGGKLRCTYNNERCLIGGQAKLYMKGEIYI